MVVIRTVDITVDKDYFVDIENEANLVKVL